MERKKKNRQGDIETKRGGGEIESKWRRIGSRNRLIQRRVELSLKRREAESRTQDKRDRQIGRGIKYGTPSGIFCRNKLRGRINKQILKK